ncbi:DUF1615 family protein [Neisseriaceae bacterium TC5R-5]|nr:DUF1615 family protein [Neisseriaceae bacterium TC5R-5]
MNYTALIAFSSTLLLAACASTSPSAPISTPSKIEATPPAAVVEPARVPPPATTPPKQEAIKPSINTEPQARALINQLLPKKIPERQGWANDIYSAFKYLKIPHTVENICAIAAIIEQESSWQADPVVPGLPTIVWNKIGERANTYLIPLAVVKAAMLKTSPTGKSYKARIDSLRTEREMNNLFEDMAREASKLGLPFNMKNPIRTGGPMQVSIEFAEAHTKVWPYPYPQNSSVRQEVFTRRGSVYFGSAILLQYPAPYKQMIYRFADFNAGRYSSRNAAFQAVVNKLSGQKLTLDGDLLNYQGGNTSTSQTQTALLSLSNKLGMGKSDILRDLKLEKSVDFGQTPLYRKVYTLADRVYGKPAPREQLPNIDLQSPKITRKLTTAWFAQRVDGRYQNCLKRNNS